MKDTIPGSDFVNVTLKTQESKKERATYLKLLFSGQTAVGTVSLELLLQTLDKGRLLSHVGRWVLLLTRIGRSVELLDAGNVL